MQLTIIIINYNVRYFLEQCLLSVQKAVAGIDAEIIVVDNASSDGSVDYLQPLFREVTFIINHKNLGFAKANNQGLTQSKGEYILFLNPDTLLPENCLHKCLQFLHDNPKAGATGVRMLDGKGRFLPESKRAFPTPLASLWKLTGLAALFPHSGFFNRYALGNLDDKNDHQVEVLAGAFFLSRKKILDELDGFDERFFLYGEDIDLSYRIRKAGWQNLYFAGTEIIHFKGESSADFKIDRIRFFYDAMRLFVQKHYQSGNASLIAALLRLAIFFRSVIALTGKILKPILLPLIDIAFVWLSLQAVRMLWINKIRNGIDFHVSFVSYALPMFAVLFVLAGALTGLYDKRYKTSRTLLSLIFAIICLLSVYSLLPETLRFSRGVMIWGSVLGSALILWFRHSLFTRIHSWMGYEWEQQRKTVVVGNENNYRSVVQLLEAAGQSDRLLGRITTHSSQQTDAIGSLENFASLKKQTGINEVIFCEGELSLSSIIQHIQQINSDDTRMLFHLSGSHSLVGSDFPGLSGRTISSFVEYRIAQPYQLRMKKIIDVLLSMLMLLTAPLHFIFHKRPAKLLSNAYQVLSGKKTWVGYISADMTGLPQIKPSVIAHTLALSQTLTATPDKLYAKNYDWWQDLLMVLSRYRGLA